MAEFEVTPYTEFITFIFPCNNEGCAGIIESNRVPFPRPNFEGENHSDSLNFDDGNLECPICQKEFEYSLGCGFGGGYLEIPDIDEDETMVHVSEFDDWEGLYEDQIDAYLEDSDAFGSFKKEIEKLRKLTTYPILDSDIEEIIFKQAYSAAITCMEEYLADTLINHVLTNDIYFRRFVESYKGFQSNNLSIAKIYKQLDGLKALVKNTLIKINYNGDKEVMTIFEAVFQIKTPSTKPLKEIIITRNDLVHRNGKTKEGDRILLDKVKIESTFQSVEKFISEIDKSIKLSVSNQQGDNPDGVQAGANIS